MTLTTRRGRLSAWVLDWQGGVVWLWGSGLALQLGLAWLGSAEWTGLDVGLWRPPHAPPPPEDRDTPPSPR